MTTDLRPPKRRLACLPIGLILLLACLIGPAFIPLPPIPNPVQAAELAGLDSQFWEVNGLQVHLVEQGAGEPVILLLHGLGASTFSWREVHQPLAQHGRVIAFDRPAFGLTERPVRGAWSGQSPYTPDAQTDLVIGLLDRIGARQAILIGNSAGGTVALHTALRYPARVRALVLVDAAIYTGGGAPAWIRPVLRLPQFNTLGPLFARVAFTTRGEEFIRLAWHDPARVTPEILAGYQAPLRIEGWDRAFWELTLAGQDLRLPERLAQVTQPALVITGDDDRIVPTEDSIRLARELPNAQLAVLPACGHVPQEECPAAFLEAVQPFIQQVGKQE